MGSQQTHQPETQPTTEPAVAASAAATYLNHAAELMADCQFVAAMIELDLAALVAPDNPVVRSRRGAAMVRLGRHQAAVNELDISIRLDKECPEAWLLRGQAHFELRDWTRAESDCNRALELAPGSVVA